MKRLAWYDYITINLFWLALNIRNNAFGSLFMPYLVDEFVRSDIRNTALGAMRTAGLVIAMLVQPAVGLLSDRNTSRFGRRRPYIFVGALLDLLFLGAIALSWNYVSLLIAILLIQVSSNISHGPLQALIPDMVPEDQRGRASAVKAIMELLPLILLAFTVARLMGLGMIDWAIFVTGAAEFVIMILTMIFVKEEPLLIKPDVPIKTTMLRVLGMLVGILGGGVAGLVGGAILGGLAGWLAASFGSVELGWEVGLGVGGLAAMAIGVVAGVWAGSLATLGQASKSESAFVWWVTNRLMFLSAITSIQSFAPFFLMYAFNIDRNEAAQTTGNLMMVVGIFTLITALPSGWLADRFGHKRLVTGSGIIAAVGTIVLLTTIWVPDMNVIIVAGIILGLATGLFTTTNWAMGTALVPQEEAGRYLGISNLAGAGAGMIGAGIGGPLADQMNQYMPGLGYFAIFACYAFLFLGSVFTLLGVKKQA
jgi:MFS family permease